MPIPISLLAGAAALLFVKKKKPTAPARLPPTTPPPLSKTVKKSSSGYPGVTRERMQEIQTMLLANGYDVGSYGTDGRYGRDTATATLGFQMDHMERSDGWDGRPGPKTQAALERLEAERLRNQQVAAGNSPGHEIEFIDECDALDPGTWGNGNVCVFEGDRWVRRSKQSTSFTKNEVPQITAKEVGFSEDYSKVEIGTSFQIGVLDAWLNQRRKSGLMATQYHGPSFVEFFSNSPTSFLASVFGIKKAGGEAIYGALTIMATGGLGLTVKAVQLAVVRLGASLSLKASSIGATASMMEKLFGTDAVGMAASAVEAARAFVETHTVIVGSKRIKISELPSDKASVKSFNKYIVDYIIKFQTMHF